MKTAFTFSATVLLFVLLMSSTLAQTNTFPANGAAGIGTITPDASSLLEIQSTTKGLLIPRMTKAKRDLIVLPATGLMIFQTNSTPGFYYYSGSTWMAVSPNGPNKTLSNLTAPTAINVDLLPKTDNKINMGSSVLGWKALYLSGSIYSDGNRFISNDATNTWLGLYTGLSNSGMYNSAFGYSALNANTSGWANTAIGYSSLNVNSTGSYNIAIGQAALYSNTTGSGNVASGVGSLYLNKSGSYNSAYGYNSLLNNTTGYSNIAIGNAALYSNTTGHNLVAVGDSALYNQANNVNDNYWNTAIGSKALYSNSYGYSNTATGTYALYSNTTGARNTANGMFALYYNTTGYGNTANGDHALYFNTTEGYNTATGSNALYFNTTGTYNTGNGSGALYSNTSGENNAADGVNALYYNTTGGNNTADGMAALYDNTTGSNNTALGFGAGVSAGNLANATAIGSGAIVDASNKVRVGNTSVTSIGGKVGWTTFPSDGRYKKNIKEDVQGLRFINSLKPITYTVDINGLDAYYNKNRRHDDAYEKMKKDMQPAADEAATIVYNGFIAQDVEAAAKKLNYNFSGVDKPKTDDGLYGLRYSDFVVPLVKAVQELSKQNDSLKDENVSLRKDFNELKNLVLSLQLKQDACNPCNPSGATAQTYNTTLTDGAALEQNIPNPFKGTTSIGYTLPQKFTTAQIMITDKNGKPLKLVNVSGMGKGKVNVDASTLASGAYNYSLLVDGKLIGTKQMVSAK